MHVVPMPFTAADAKKATEESSDWGTLQVKAALKEIVHHIKYAAADGRNEVYVDTPPLNCSDDALSTIPGSREVRDRILESLREAGYHVDLRSKGGVILSWDT